MITRSLARVACAAAVVFCAGAAQPGAQAGSQWLGAHETFGDPPPPFGPPLAVHPRSPGMVVERHGVISVQVNVDANGDNIVDDAANEPSLAVDPTDPNKIVIGWRQFDHIWSNFRQAGWAYSHDGGQTWTFPGVVDPGVFRSDPVLDVDSSGNFYYLGVTDGYPVAPCHVFKSLDGGVTWGAPVYVGGGDKPWLVIDRTGGMGEGHVYTTWQIALSCCGWDTFSRSIDDGMSFEYPVEMPDSPKYGTMSVGPDGTVYVAGHRSTLGTPRPLRVAISTDAKDAGVTPTFQTIPVNLGGFLVEDAPPNPVGIAGQLQVVTDHSGGPTHGNVYVLASVSWGAGMKVHFTRSTDGGLTWPYAAQIDYHPEQHDTWQWFGAISVAPNGRIDVIWNDTRNTGADNLSELFYAYSLDAGQTWLGKLPVGPVWDSHLGWPNQNKIGDYYDMVSDNTCANLAYAATYNGEQDVYFARLGDCNGNGIHDGADIASGFSPDNNANGYPDECENTLGDLNCDGWVNNGDVDAFVFALSYPEQYADEYPNCDIMNGDINADGWTNNGDIDAFVALLTGQ